MNKKILLFLFLFIPIIQAQDLYFLFKSYLPKEHIKSTNPYTLDKQLKTDAELDPGLIYLRILYYEKNLVDNDINPETNYLNNIRALTFEKQTEKNLFIKKEIEKLKLKYSGKSFYSDCENYLNAVLFPPKKYDGKTFTIKNYNSNLDSYLRYIYLSKNNLGKYDSTINYSNIYNSEVERFKEVAIKNCKNFSDNSGIEKLKILQDIFANWTIFKDEFGKSMPELHELVVMTLNENENSLWKSTYGVYAAFHLGFPRRNISLMLSNFPELSSLIRKSQDAELAKVNMIGHPEFGITYKLRLKKDNSTFSYVSASVGASMLKGGVDPGLFFYQNHFTSKVKNADSTVETETFIRNPKITLDYYYGLNVSLSTPVFCFTNSITGDVGILYTIEKVNYKYEMDYDYDYLRITNTYGAAYKLRDQHSSLSYSKTEHKIYPLFSLNVLIFDFIKINLKYNFKNLAVQGGFEF